MNSLVDYDSSESEDLQDKDDESIKEDLSESGITKLPKPEFADSGNITTSVFANPFVQAELAKNAILEKHVKMVPTKDENTFTVNGKKICWNYRKGRCRFGANCKYGHDSDVQLPVQENCSEKKMETLEPQTANDGLALAAEDPATDAWEENQKRTKLKRPGLATHIVPSKKALKFHKKVMNK